MDPIGVSGYTAALARKAMRWIKGGYEFGELGNGCPARRNIRSGIVEIHFNKPSRWIPAHSDHWKEFKTNENMAK